MKHFIFAILMVLGAPAVANTLDQIPYAKEDIIVDGYACMDCPMTYAKKIVFRGKSYAVQYQNAGGWSSDGNRLVAVCSWTNYASVTRCEAETSNELIIVYNRVIEYYGVIDTTPIELPTSPTLMSPTAPDNLDSGTAATK